MAKIGIYNLGMQTKGGGEKLTLVLADHLSMAHDVWLFCAKPLDRDDFEKFFRVDLTKVKVVPLDDPDLRSRIIARARGSRSHTSPLHHYRQIAKLDLDLFINITYRSNLSCPASRGLYVCMFPHELRHVPQNGSRRRRIADALIDLSERFAIRLDPKTANDSYSRVAAISAYTAEWTKKIWGRTSDLVYPPCEEMAQTVSKDKIILNVGRFQADTGENEFHHKAQDVLLETFRGLTEVHDAGWQLHFMGTIEGGERSSHFSSSLVERAKGLPVVFHFNPDFEKIRQLYGRAAIYWHATGCGHSAENYPAKQEHFGITTVEAMSAGAVPVVINSGGQKEIVTHEVDGLLWDNVASLANQTLRIINDSELRERLSERAVTTSYRFRRQRFTTGMTEVINRLLEPPADLQPSVNLKTQNAGNALHTQPVEQLLLD